MNLLGIKRWEFIGMLSRCRKNYTTDLNSLLGTGDLQAILYISINFVFLSPSLHSVKN